MNEEEEEIDLNDPFLVVFDGEPKYFLNKSLFKRQGLMTDKQIDITALEEIKELHIQKLTIFKAMEECDDSVQLKIYAEAVKTIEFALQQAWGFEMDENFHHWFEVPKCQCPKMDNRERVGTKYGIRVQSCPIHGW